MQTPNSNHQEANSQNTNLKQILLPDSMRNESPKDRSSQPPTKMKFFRKPMSMLFGPKTLQFQAVKRYSVQQLRIGGKAGEKRNFTQLLKTQKSLEGIQIEDTKAIQDLQQLSHARCLKKFQIEECEESKVCSLLQQLHRNIKSLEDLDLCVRSLYEIHFDLFAPVLADKLRIFSSSLKHLSLSNKVHQIMIGPFQGRNKLIMQIGTNFRKLETLKISFKVENNFTDGDIQTTFRQIGVKLKPLKRLELFIETRRSRDLEISIQAMETATKQIGSNLRNLQHLKLHVLKGEKFEGKILKEFIIQIGNNLKMLRHFDLNLQRFSSTDDDEVAEAIGANLKRLRSLGLNFPQVEDFCLPILRSIGENLNQLRELELNFGQRLGCCCTKELITLAKYFATGLKNLESIDLPFNACIIEDEALLYLAVQMEQHLQLRRFRFGNGYNKFFSQTVLTKALSRIVSMETLLDLSLTLSETDNEHVNVLSTKIGSKLKRLRSLHFHCFNADNVTDQSVVELAQQIGTLRKTLQFLSISICSNKLSDESAKAFHTVIMNNLSGLQCVKIAFENSGMSPSGKGLLKEIHLNYFQE